jgi:hypothetical protein
VAPNNRPLLNQAVNLESRPIHPIQLLSGRTLNSSGDLAVRITSNEFNLVPGQIAFKTRPDHNTLVVTGRKGEVLGAVLEPESSPLSWCIRLRESSTDYHNR